MGGVFNGENKYKKYFLECALQFFKRFPHKSIDDAVRIGTFSNMNKDLFIRN